MGYIVQPLGVPPGAEICVTAQARPLCHFGKDVPIIDAGEITGVNFVPLSRYAWSVEGVDTDCLQRPDIDLLYQAEAHTILTSDLTFGLTGCSKYDESPSRLSSISSQRAYHVRPAATCMSGILHEHAAFCIGHFQLGTSRKTADSSIRRAGPNRQFLSLTLALPQFTMPFLQ
jgi:hypothetical protein